MEGEMGPGVGNHGPAPEYAIVEIMGHRRYGAQVSTVQRWGGTFLHCRVLAEPPFEQYVSPGSIFALTPCTEEQARAACSRRVAPEEIRPALAEGEPVAGYLEEGDADPEIIDGNADW